MYIKNSSLLKLTKYVYEKIQINETISSKKSPLNILFNLFECLYFSSMQTEEGELLKVTITFIDPSDNKKLKRPKADHWKLVEFKTPIEFNTRNIVKLSKAADPWSSSIAVYFDKDEKLWINGMIDQAIHSQSFYNHEQSLRPTPVGIFQVQIEGIGMLSVIRGHELLATLRQNVIITRYLDVLKYGDVSKIIRKQTDFVKNEISNYTSQEHVGTSLANWIQLIEGLFRETYSRLLINIKNYKHGGAILISDQTVGLKIKYSISYDRVSKAILNYLKWHIANHVYWQVKAEYQESDTIDEIYEKDDGVKLQQEGINIANELKGSIKFVASQSRVDGLILLNSKFELRGFGVVVSRMRLPKYIYQCQNNTVTEDALTERKPDDFGTRHRSMISQCWNNPNSLGFVISQDGDIRAFLRVADKLIMWENIKTQKFVKRKEAFVKF